MGVTYVVTATLNGLDHTKRLVESLKLVIRNGIELRLVLIDNGSTDATLDWARTLESDSGAQIIANERNLGAAGAWNQGIRFALQNNAEAVLVCGNDTWPMPGTIERLHDLLRQGVLFVTGTQVPYDKPEVHIPLAQPHESLRAAPDFSFFLFRPMPVVERIGLWDLVTDRLRQAECTKAHPDQMIAPLQNPWTFGLFDDSFYPAYFEDGDFHHRAASAGLHLVCDPGALFRHDCSLTIRINADIGKANATRTFQANAERFRNKWGGLPYEVLINGKPVQSARPLNVTDDQWQQMTAGHPVEELDQATVIADAQHVYGEYGIEPIRSSTV